jgi:signal transduction histidine kinase
VESSQPLIESFKHQLTVRLPDDPVLIRGDAVRLTQAIANLLKDAAVYTEPGGRIDVDARRVDHDVRLSVRDSGIGHSPDSLERIFERVSQIPPGRERVQKGIGTGLALVRQLVELHGGSVLVRSEDPEHGGEILVHLPALVDQGIDRVEPVPLESSPTRPLAATETASTPLPQARIDIDTDDRMRDAQAAIPRGGSRV